MSIYPEPTKNFLEPCCICGQFSVAGKFLYSLERKGLWSHWACLACLEWLDQIEKHNYDRDEGEK